MDRFFGVYVGHKELSVQISKMVWLAPSWACGFNKNVSKIGSGRQLPKWPRLLKTGRSGRTFLGNPLYPIQIFAPNILWTLQFQFAIKE